MPSYILILDVIDASNNKQEVPQHMETANLVLSSVVTTEMLSGVLDEIVGLIPVALPVAISLLSVRKAWSWLMGTLHTA